MRIQDEADLRSRFAFEARVCVGVPMEIGVGPRGLCRVVPITGGSFKGPRIEGRVLPGGADCQFVRPDGVLAVEAKYTLETDDRVLIMITNRGLRHGPKEVIERLAKGEPVSPSEYYFRTCAEFEAPVGGKYDWLNRALFMGVAERKTDAAIVRFYELL